MTTRGEDGATVVLPRWFVVLMLGAVATGSSAFLRVTTQLEEVKVRLAVIETRLAIPAVRRTQWPDMQIAPEASADSL